MVENVYPHLLRDGVVDVDGWFGTEAMVGASISGGHGELEREGGDGDEDVVGAGVRDVDGGGVRDVIGAGVARDTAGVAAEEREDVRTVEPERYSVSKDPQACQNIQANGAVNVSGQGKLEGVDSADRTTSLGIGQSQDIGNKNSENIVSAVKPMSLDSKKLPALQNMPNTGFSAWSDGSQSASFASLSSTKATCGGSVPPKAGFENRMVPITTSGSTTSSEAISKQATNPTFGAGPKIKFESPASDCVNIDQTSADAKSVLQNSWRPSNVEWEDVDDIAMLDVPFAEQARRPQNIRAIKLTGPKATSLDTAASVNPSMGIQDSSLLLREEHQPLARESENVGFDCQTDKPKVQVDWERHYLKKRLLILRQASLKPGISETRASQLQSKIAHLDRIRKSLGKVAVQSKGSLRHSQRQNHNWKERAILEVERFEREAERTVGSRFFAKNEGEHLGAGSRKANIAQTKYQLRKLRRAAAAPWPEAVNQREEHTAAQRFRIPNDVARGTNEESSKQRDHPSALLIEEDEDDIEMPSPTSSISELVLSSPCDSCPDRGYQGHFTSNYCQRCLKWGHGMEKCPMGAAVSASRISFGTASLPV